MTTKEIRESNSRQRQAIAKELAIWTDKIPKTPEEIAFVKQEIDKCQGLLKDLNKGRAKQVAWARGDFKGV